MANEIVVEIKRLVRLLDIGRGEFIALAREVSHNGTIVCLSQLSRHERENLLERLEAIQAGCIRRAWSNSGALMASV